MSKCISRDSEFGEHTLDADWTCTRCSVQDLDALKAERDEARAMADRLAATLVLALHDAHPSYANTTGWRGGIGGQTITHGCSIIDPPPGHDWTQYDLLSTPAREWLNQRPDFDLKAAKESIKAELGALLNRNAAEETR